MSVVLSEHLPLLASAPDGIQKLRGLILELAVRGKLVPQDPNDEPASELLKRIVKKRALLEEEGVCKKAKSVPPVDANEQPFPLPLGWSWARLAQIQIFTNGYAFPSGEFSDQGIGVIRISDVWHGEVLLSKIARFPAHKAQSLDHKYIVNAGELVMTMTGSVKLGFNNTGETLLLNQRVGKITPIIVSPQYLYRLLVTKAEERIQAASGSVIANVSTEEIQSIVVPLPPLAEQHRIVAKVDELMTLCDRLEAEQADSASAHARLVETLLGTLTQSTDAADLAANWQRLTEYFETLFTTEASIDVLKQTVLQLAVMGKLVRQDTSDEPAEVLLQKIAAEKLRLIKEGKLKEQKPSSSINDDEKLFELPVGWAWARLQSVIDVRDGTHDSPKDASGPDTYPLVTSKNFVNGGIDFDSARRISAPDHFEIAKRSAVEKFDILFSMIGGNLGNQVMVKDERQFSVKNVALFKYYNREMTSPFFVKKYMEHLALDLQEKAIGGAQPFVSLGFLRNLVVALPPIAEQHRIVVKVDELMALCDRLKADLATSRQHQATLADTLIESALEAA